MSSCNHCWNHLSRKKVFFRIEVYALRTHLSAHRAFSWIQSTLAALFGRSFATSCFLFGLQSTCCSTSATRFNDPVKMICHPLHTWSSKTKTKSSLCELSITGRGVETGTDVQLCVVIFYLLHLRLSVSLNLFQLSLQRLDVLFLIVVSVQHSFVAVTCNTHTHVCEDCPWPSSSLITGKSPISAPDHNMHHNRSRACFKQKLRWQQSQPTAALFRFFFFFWSVPICGHFLQDPVSAKRSWWKFKSQHENHRTNPLCCFVSPLVPRAAGFLPASSGISGSAPEPHSGSGRCRWSSCPGRLSCRQ